MSAAPQSAPGANKNQAHIGEAAPMADQISAALRKILVTLHERPGDAVAATGYTLLGIYALLLLGRVIVG